MVRPGTADVLVDLDGDGRVDLVDTGSGLRYWRGDGSGRFAEGAGTAWHGEPEAVLADFAGDAAPDLIAHFQLSFDRLLQYDRAAAQ